MRLVEVVVLMGAHCISPIEHDQAQMITDATKVQCAVVVEKDTGTRTLKVTPDTMSADPRVMAAIARLEQKSGPAKIVPAFAPAGSPTKLIKPQPPLAAALSAPATAPADTEAETAAKPAATVTETETPAKAEPKAENKAEPKPAKPQRAQKAKTEKTRQVAAAPAAQGSSQCKGSAVAKWYTTADGRKKYRCVRPEPAGGKAPGWRMPAQIY